jgi:CHAT domain-containing protein
MKSLLLSLLPFVTCAALCAAQATGNVLELDSTHPVSVLLHSEKAVTLRLDASGSEAEEIFLDTAAQDVSFRIVSTGGTEIQSGRVSTYGWAAIPLATRDQGQFQFQLISKGAVQGLPGIRVRAELLPIELSALPAHLRAAHAFSNAQALHRSLRAEDLRVAILHFQQASDEWRRCGDLYGVAIALSGKAESLIELSRYQEALSTAKYALSLDTGSGYLSGWLNHLLSRVYLDQWEAKPAREFAQATLQLGIEIRDPALIALGRTDLVGIAFWDFDSDANQVDDQAHAEAIAAGVPETLGLERQWKAWLEEEVEHNTRAATVMTEAETYFRFAGDLRTSLEVTGQVAQAIRLTGDVYSALSRLLELEAMTKATGNLLYYGILAENIGEIHFELGKPRYAAVYYQLAKRAYASAHFGRGLMYIYGDLCHIEIRSNAMFSAVADCNASLTLARQTQEPVFIGKAEYELGLADRKAGRLTQALANFTEAARNSPIRTDLLFESQERIQLGELLDEGGKKEEALAQFQDAEKLAEGVSDPASLLEAQFSVAHWYEQDGQYEKAIAELKTAIEKVEATRRSVSESTLQASYFAAERKCYELAVDLQMQQFKRDPSSKGDALGLELSERSHARGLLDTLDARLTTGRQETGRAESRLMKSNLAVDQAFERRLKLLVGEGNKRNLEASSTELTKALASLELAEENVNSTPNQAIKSAATMTTAQIEQASSRSKATFVEYVLGEERSYIWVISGGGRKSYVLPSRRQLENMVTEWLKLVSSHGSAAGDKSAQLQHLSARLSCALLDDHVEANMERIVIVPDDGLSLLPFAALPENGCSRTPGEPLLVHHQITLTPSLSVFLHEPAAESQKFRGEVAVIADPVFDVADSRAVALKIKAHNPVSQMESGPETGTELPRLINSGYEATAIRAAVRQATGDGKVFLAQGFDAKLETVLSPEMQGYRIWHLATHGVYDESIPEFSGLVFTLLQRDGSPRFGFLKAHDIARLNVPAELVVLSACDSAAGENVNGEGVMGLSYAFLHAGAKQVIATLWSVDDARSRELMVAFYRELMRNGRNTAEALRQSQLRLMRNRATSSPYFWAGFTLTTAVAN